MLAHFLGKCDWLNMILLVKRFFVACKMDHPMQITRERNNEHPHLAHGLAIVSHTDAIYVVYLCVFCPGDTALKI